MEKLKKYRITIISRCTQVVEVEAEDGAVAVDLVRQGEYDKVIEVDHADSEILDAKEVK